QRLAQSAGRAARAYGVPAGGRCAGPPVAHAGIALPAPAAAGAGRGRGPAMAARAGRRCRRRMAGGGRRRAAGRIAPGPEWRPGLSGLAGAAGQSAGPGAGAGYRHAGRQPGKKRAAGVDRCAAAPVHRPDAGRGRRPGALFPVPGQAGGASRGARRRGAPGGGGALADAAAPPGHAPPQRQIVRPCDAAAHGAILPVIVPVRPPARLAGIERDAVLPEYSMYVDSHCHLDFPDLAQDLPAILQSMAANRVTHALVVSVDLPDWPRLIELVEPHRNLWASVGVHPDYEASSDPTESELLQLSRHPKVVAIGETGLDYYRLSEPLDWQRERFRRHIRVARQAGLPLIIHTRESVADTLRILREENAAEVGGVMHCFTESWEMAQAAMDLN